MLTYVSSSLVINHAAISKKCRGHWPHTISVFGLDYAPWAVPVVAPHGIVSSDAPVIAAYTLFVTLPASNES